MIEELLYLILFTSLTVLAYKVATSEGMLLESISAWVESKKKYEYFICVWCLPSLFTLFGFAFAFILNVLPFEWHWEYLALYLLCVCGSSLVCGLVWAAYALLDSKKDYYDIAQKHTKNIEQLSFWDRREREERFKSRANSKQVNY